MPDHRLAGVHAAAITPLTPEGQPDLKTLPALLDGLQARGCHGALLLGTTGEGPSFSSAERAAIMRAAADWGNSHPDFTLMAGTGTPSLTESIELNTLAFELGFDAVVTLPPYFLRNAGDAGLLDWFTAVIEASVPEGRHMLGYHIPQVAGVGLSGELLARLRSAFPLRFAGIKDSTGRYEHAQTLLGAIDADFVLLAGNDSLLAAELAIGASGCITAMANVFSREARAVYDAFIAGEETAPLQSRLSALREIMDSAAPLPASIKALLPEFHGLPVGTVRAPLRMLDAALIAEKKAALESVLAG